WSIWEGHGGFLELKGAKYSLPLKGHPEEVGMWIKHYQRIRPKIASICEFADTWWIWWRDMQPEWHNANNGEGVMGSKYQAAIERDWGKLVKQGPNGFTSPLAGLLWWG
ncbi:hypothetical protein ARMGADRAFT_872049, partial [Armillaria gallica]